MLCIDIVKNQDQDMYNQQLKYAEMIDEEKDALKEMKKTLEATQLKLE